MSLSILGASNEEGRKKSFPGPKKCNKVGGFIPSSHLGSDFFPTVTRGPVKRRSPVFSALVLVPGEALQTLLLPSEAVMISEQLEE